MLGKASKSFCAFQMLGMYGSYLSQKGSDPLEGMQNPRQKNMPGEGQTPFETTAKITVVAIPNRYNRRNYLNPHAMATYRSWVPEKWLFLPLRSLTGVVELI